MHDCSQFGLGTRSLQICLGESELPLRKVNAFRALHGIDPFTDNETSADITGEKSQVRASMSPNRPGQRSGGCCGKKTATPAVVARYAVTGTGVGGRLIEMFAAAGFEACEACYELAHRMNEWGVDGCRTNLEMIVADILPRALIWEREKVGWWARLLPEAVTEAAIKLMVEQAIATARPLEWVAEPKQVVNRAVRHDPRKFVTRPTAGQNSHTQKHVGPMTPVRATISDTRNLIYHLWPSNISGNWKIAVAQLLKRIDLFNGVRSISVVTDSSTASLADVHAEFAGVRVDNWLTFPNNPQLREGVSFLPLMATLPNDDSVTFLGHSKSARHHEGSICVGWAETQYKLLLDDWTSIARVLTLFPIVGAFKRYMRFGRKCRFGWHYSGGAYWFRQADVFDKPDWKDQLDPWFGATESWPGGVFPSQQAYCVGPDNVGDLYKPEPWAAIQPAIDSLFRVRDKINSGIIDDETFYAQSEWIGYTTWDWLPLVEAHTRAAVYIRDVLGCRSVLEIGSGLGMFLVGAAAAKIDLRGVDRNALERGFAISKGIPAERYDLSLIDSYTIHEPVDVVYSCEVFEHCRDEELAPLCRQIAANCRWFYFTSTPHKTTEAQDQRWGHINIKSREEWLAFFSQFGLTWNRDDESVCEWGMVLEATL